MNEPVPAPPAALGGPTVCCVSPTYFAPESVVGGGERFAEELALALSRRVRVKLVSFGLRRFREAPCERCERVILRSWTRAKLTPFSPRLFAELRGAEVIHCFQHYTLPTFLACLKGRLQGSRVFVTDLGGGGWTPAYHLDPSPWITAHLPISTYAARDLARQGRPLRVVYGGVDLDRWPLRSEATHDGSVVFLGRLLPHKGIHHLIEGLPPGVELDVIGTEAEASYLAHLQDLARGRCVRFHRRLPDRDVVPFLRRAMALVHPTPIGADGSAAAAELFGLALVEAMACGCPVVASRAASLPEIVEDGVTGLLVAPNAPAAIAAALARLREDHELWRRMSAAARARVESFFTWDRVAERCLAAYGADFRIGEDRGVPRPGPRPSRQIAWMSSVTGEAAALSDLARRMDRFYRRPQERRAYQEMLDGQAEEAPAPASVRQQLPGYVRDLAPAALLEIGCGGGRLYRQLRARGWRGRYTGVEIEPALLARDRRRHPEASWRCAAVYELPFRRATFDACVALYVLEHLVFPERALQEMLRTVRPGGRVVLVFPDFTASGILPSQAIGLAPGGTATEKLRAGRILDAFASLYDSRLRVRRLLRQAPERFGPFPVNRQPLCLVDPSRMVPDVDAVYIASKHEVHRWAAGNGLAVEYPAGTGGEFACQAFMALGKPL